MIALLAALALAAPTNSAMQDPREVDTLRALARAGADSALVERVRRGASDAQVAVPRLLADAAAGSSDSTQEASLAAAQRLATAVAVAWRDSFLLRRVARFRSLSPAERQANIKADSLRRAGIAALWTKGTHAAMGLFREALRRSESLADTAGMAAALNAIGIGFHNLLEYDSASAYFDRTADYAERTRDYRAWGAAVASRGNVRQRQGDFDAAGDAFAQARQIYERGGDAVGVLTTINSLGIAAWSRGDLAGARRAFESGLAGSRRINDPVGIPMFIGNLGAVAAQGGDYPEATARLQEVIAIYRKQENWLQVAATLPKLGEVKRRRGEYRAAISSLGEALTITRRLGPGGSITEEDETSLRSRLASVRADMGDLQGARAELEQAERFVSRSDQTRAPGPLVELALTRGDIELRFNRLGEAQRQYARAGRLARGIVAENHRRRAEIGLGSVFFKRGNYKRSQTALEQALSRRDPDNHLTALIRLQLGRAAERHGDTASAWQAFRQAIDTLRALGAIADEAEALGALAALEAGAGHSFTAESLYQEGITRIRRRSAPEVAWQLHAGLAASLRSRGALAEAAGELLAGIGEIEQVAGGLELEEQRSAFQADKWDVYVDLALIEYQRGRTGSAFETSERLRARQMLDLLARGRIGRQGPLGQLAVREQDLRRRIGELAMEARDSQPAEQTQVLRDRAAQEGSSQTGNELARMQEDYGKLLLEIRSTDPSYAGLVRGETVAARTVMAALGPDEALLEYLVGDSTTLVFIVTRDTVAGLDLKLSHDALTAQVDFARSGLASPKESAARRPWRAPLRRLYGQLIGPVEASGLLSGKRRLLIAPHAELHYLPFSALVRAGPPEQLLIERYLIDYVPSASVWLRLRGRSRPSPSPGVLALAPRAAALPGSRSEIAAIKRIYGERAQTMVGSSATEPAFRSLASNREIIHLATYGVLNKHNPLFSYVELGKAPGEDGRLEVHEVFGLDLNARLLVLSACQTGLAAGALSDVPPGDDWVGLVQGFLYAGAGNVVATLWPVADVATARLMERFYEELATGGSETEALAQAQRAALRDPLTAHPFYWAGFTLVRGR